MDLRTSPTARVGRGASPAGREARNSLSESPLFARQFDDRWVAALLFAAALALYALTFQSRVYGDGVLFVPWIAHGTSSLAGARHPLYLSLARAIVDVAPWLEPGIVLRSLSAVGGAAAVAFTWSAARALGTGRRGSLVSAALLGLAPAAWFFATTVELHALHMGTVALGMYALARAPWGRPGLARLVAVLPVPLVLTSHLSGVLLLPGWVLAMVVLERRGASSRAAAPGGFVDAPDVLGGAPGVLGDAPGNAIGHADEAAARRTAPSTLLRSVLQAAIAVGLAALASGGLSLALRGVGLNAGNTTQGFVAEHLHAPLWRGVAPIWLGGLGLLVPAALFGAYQLRKSPWLLATGALLVLPPFAFFLVWGPPENSAYTLGSAPVLALLAAHAAYRPRLVRWEFAALLLATQVLFAWPRVVTQDVQAAELGESRAALVREALGDEGVLLSLEPSRQPIEDRLSGVVEFNLYPQLRGRIRAGEGPRGLTQEYLPFVLGRVHWAEEEGLPIAIDRGYRDWLDEDPELAAARLEFEAALRRALHVEQGSADDGRIWVLSER